MALPAQPADIFRSVANFLSVREGARAAAAVPGVTRFTAERRRKLQLSQWGWLFPGIVAATPFEEVESWLRELGVETVDLTEREAALWTQAVRSLEEGVTPFTEVEREEFLFSRLPLFAQHFLIEGPAKEAEEQTDHHKFLLLPAGDHTPLAGDDDGEVNLKAEDLLPHLTRLALVEADFATVLTAFIHDSSRYRMYRGKVDNVNTLVDRALRRQVVSAQAGSWINAPEWLKELPAWDQPRNFLLATLFLRGLLSVEGKKVILSGAVPDSIGCLILPRPGLAGPMTRVPPVIYQALSVLGYDFLKDQVTASGERHGSLFAQWTNAPSLYPDYIAPQGEPDYQDSIYRRYRQEWGQLLIADETTKMEIMLDRLLVQGRLTTEVSEGWATLYTFDGDQIPHEPAARDPLSALCESVGTELYELASLDELEIGVEHTVEAAYRQVLTHLQERGVTEGEDQIQSALDDLRDRVEATPDEL